MPCTRQRPLAARARSAVARRSPSSHARFCSASATAEYLAEQLTAAGQSFDAAGVYVLGGPGVQEELKNVGIRFKGA